MGLTIHYKLKAGRNGDKEDLMQAAQKFAAEQIRPQELSEVAYFNKETIAWHLAHRNSDWRWSLIQAGKYVKLDERSSLDVPPVEACLFRMWPGEGCEEANFGLCRYPATIKHNGRKIKTRLSGWTWSSFCKTTYAREFLKCHLMVVAMLDWFDDHGLVEYVSDEGDYWQDRNLQALGATHGEDLGLLAAFAGALKDGWSDGNLQAPILDHPDFERLELEGLKKHPNTLAFLNAIRNLKR